MEKAAKKLFFKSIKYFVYTAFLMFLAPIVIWQAFKNQNHSWYYPVLTAGILLAVAAIAMGFYSLKLIIKSISN
jgi:Family of unknown function (DUF6095)